MGKGSTRRPERVPGSYAKGYEMAFKKHTNARKCQYRGIKFDSQKEMMRYIVLEANQKAGQIEQLKVHPHFDFVVNGQKVGRGYTADFSYLSYPDGMPVVEEVKGRVFRDWPLRRDLFMALHDCVFMVNGKEVKRKKAK